MPTDAIFQLGALAVIVIYTIGKVFDYLKTKKNLTTETTHGNDISNLILSELQAMNGNHLHTIQEVIQEGNARLVETIHSDNVRMIELLAEIKGNLQK